MKTIGMIAQKGGSGKTTLSIHLAVQASLSGLNVLLVDMDPQGSAGAWWRRRRGDRPELIQTVGENLEKVLQEAEERNYDLTVVDTAPHASQDARTCAALADQVCIPTRPAILDLDAIRPTTDLVSEIRVPAFIVLNACPPPTTWGEPHIVREAREALSLYRIPVCEIAISQRVAFSHALIDGQSVTEYESDGKGAKEIEGLWSTVRAGIDL
jgi:chromosome partitioning protein